MGRTSIPWTNATWNPIRGCSRVSEGCRHCYAERFAARSAKPGEPFHGLVTVRSKASGLRYRDPRAAGSWTEPRWTGEVHFAEDHFADPLRWRRKQRMVFVNSVSDLFHEQIPFELIAAIVGIMGAASGHVFQVLTKRPERMAEFMAWLESQGRAHSFPGAFWYCLRQAQQWLDNIDGPVIDIDRLIAAWPLPNVWWGVSVENQKAANERIPILADVPAAVRWLSVEPLLEGIELPRHDQSMGRSYSPVDWVVLGGESGGGARPFDLNWARALREQCERTCVPFFFKQAGARVLDGGKPIRLESPKGEDLAELPAELQVREWPGRRARDWR